MLNKHNNIFKCHSYRNECYHSILSTKSRNIFCFKGRKKIGDSDKHGQLYHVSCYKIFTAQIVPVVLFLDLYKLFDSNMNNNYNSLSIIFSPIRSRSKENRVTCVKVDYHLAQAMFSPP